MTETERLQERVEWLERQLELARRTVGKERLELSILGSNACTWDFELDDGKLVNARATYTNVFELLGYTEADDTHHFPDALAAFIPPDRQATFVADVQAHLDGTDREWENVYPVRHRDGSERWHLGRGVIQRHAAGQARRFTGISIDITELKRIEAELQAAREAAELANRAKDEFLANVSHEIRTPMNAILGMTELALDAAETAHQKQLLSTVKVAARSLLHVINDLLDFSKITTGKLALEPADFSLRAAIADTVRALSVRAHRKGLEFITHVHHDVPDLYFGDAGRVRQVLMNLIGNAIKFTARGEVVVEVLIDPDAAAGDGAVPLRFTVRDTGIGISPAKHASIFHAFEQADASTTREFGGTGLGLTISSQLAALMGGRITVGSEPGRGSSFSFTARIQRSSKPEWPGLASPVALEGIEVLVVDDNQTNRAILLEWLSSWHMRPTAAADAASTFEALERAHESSNPFAVVLLDAWMPDTDGIALAERIRERFGPSAHRIILLSSDHDPALAARSREAGIHGFLLKPVQQAELLETMWAVINSSTADTGPGDPGAAARSAGRVRSLHVLVAEDNELNVAVLRALLGQRGHSVEVAGDGRSALELVSSGGVYDLMLVDLHMPRMDGFELVQAIRERERETGMHLPIIALTARSSPRDRERALAVGMDDFLSKPIEVEELWSAIDRATADVAPARRRLSALLDARAILRMCGGRPDVLARLCEVFRTTVPARMAAIRAAFDRRDLASLRVAAHVLAGTVLAFSSTVGVLASTLEDAASDEDLALCTTLAQRLEILCATLLEDTRGLTLEALGG